MPLIIFKQQRSLLTSVACFEGMDPQEISRFVSDTTALGYHIQIAYHTEQQDQASDLKKSVKENGIGNVRICHEEFTENCWEGLLSDGFNTANTLCLITADERDKYREDYEQYGLAGHEAHIQTIGRQDLGAMYASVNNFQPS